MKRTLKIGLVLDDSLDKADGVQQYVLTLGRWLAEQGHDVHYLVGATKRADITTVHSLSQTMNVRFNGNRMSMPLPASKQRLQAILNSEAFDVIHVQVPYSPFLAGRILACLPPKTAVIGTFHILPNSRLVTLANHGLAVLNYRSGKQFDVMIANSLPSAAFAKRVYRYDPKVIPLPINLAPFTVKDMTKTTTIVFLGRLVPRKGAVLLIKALAALKQNKLTNQAFKVKIGGKGPQLAELQKLVNNTGLTDLVEFVGFVDEASKPAFLAQADIAVYPSTGGESFGIVLLEAMAAARGVVLAGNNPGYASVMPVADQVFDPKDTPAFARLLSQWLDDPAGRAGRANVQQQYVKQFGTATVCKQIEKVYYDILQKK